MNRRFGTPIVVVFLLLAALLTVAQDSEPAYAADLPVVYILATGGTIANVGDAGLEGFEGLAVEKLVESVPDLRQYAQLRFEQVVNISSEMMTPEIWLKLAQRINEIAKDKDVKGIVVTHGTDTMEETGYFLNLTVKSDKPVVLTGAQIPARYVDSDGPRNLISAVRVASSPNSQNKGVMIVSTEREIYAARDVSKTHTVRVDAFDSGELGLMGCVDEDGVHYYYSPAKRHTIASEFDIANVSNLPRVDIVYTYGGADGTAVEAFVEKGAKGLVIAGTGAGGAPASVLEAAEAAIEKGVVVAGSTRVYGGRVRASSVDVGIPTDNLGPQKSRILLMLALNHTKVPEEIQKIFQTY